MSETTKVFPGRNRNIHNRGYVRVHVPNHPRANANGYVYEHILVVERAMRKYLPGTAQVHHVNRARGDNRPRNLVACQDQRYHALIERRARAFAATGDASAMKCRHCGEWDSQENLYVLPQPHERKAYHRACERAVRRARMQRGRAVA